MSSVLQITLKDVLVIENGRAEAGVEGVNSLSATLYYPHAGTPAVTSMRPLRLQDNELLDYTQQPFKEQLLFKERIHGDSVLEVEISAIEKASRFEKLVAKLMGVAATTGAGLIPGLGVIATAVVTSATGSVFALADPGDEIRVIGRGAMPIREDVPEGDFVVNLAVPQQIALKQRRTNEDGKEVTRTKTLQAGFVNAKVVFQVRRLGEAR